MVSLHFIIIIYQQGFRFKVLLIKCHSTVTPSAAEIWHFSQTKALELSFVR